jgi:hypothetical protein
VKAPTVDTSRDEKIIAALRSSMSGWLEARSVAFRLRTSDANISDALTRLLAEGRVQRRILTGTRAGVEWSVTQ